METIATTRRIGGSLVVTIPSEIAKLENIKEKDIVQIEVKKKRRDFFGALKGIGSFTEEDRARGQLE